MEAKNLKFMEELSNDRIKEKFNLLETTLFFKYALENNKLYVENKKHELEFYNEKIKQYKNYLINCGYKLEFIDNYINDYIETLKNRK